MKVSETLGLSHPFDSQTAINVTNKKYMKTMMIDHGIPTAKYYQVGLDSDLSALALDYPLIVKPVDGCGAAGVQMSGSGSCVFGLFPDGRTAEGASEELVRLGFRERCSASGDTRRRLDQQRIEQFEVRLLDQMHEPVVTLLVGCGKVVLGVGVHQALELFKRACTHDGGGDMLDAALLDAHVHDDRGEGRKRKVACRLPDKQHEDKR